MTCQVNIGWNMGVLAIMIFGTRSLCNLWACVALRF